MAKKSYRRKTHRWGRTSIAAAALGLMALVLLVRLGIDGAGLLHGAASETVENAAESAEEESGSKVKLTPVTPLESIIVNDVEYVLPNHHEYKETARENQIYSYVQAPPEYYVGDPKWLGEWCHIMAGGQEFIYFGCGICCLSNIYSTFQAKDIPPDIVYDWAKEYVHYAPESGVGAMSWGQLKGMCEKFGLGVELCRKPSDYSVFQKEIGQSEACIVLVSKVNDDKLWWYTNGHYVNLWEYDPETDTVFLSDASNLYNRARVSLRDVYNALKTSSEYQFLIAYPD